MGKLGLADLGVEHNLITQLKLSLLAGVIGVPTGGWLGW